MRVAIIGAGVSGAACAFELERHGVTPDIFEEKPRTGDLFTHCGALLQIMNRPVKDPIKELFEKYQILINPLNPIKEITMHAPKATGSVYGNLGYFARRGQAKDSIENQVLGHLKTPVHFNVRADCSHLARDYDYVIVATGNSYITKVFGCWTDIFKSLIIGTTVLGSFDPCTLEMWLNTEYASSGYAYLAPFSNKSACLALAVKDANRENIDNYWNMFWQIEKFQYECTTLWYQEHISGLVYPHQVDNILFIGNAGGFLDPFLGFGLYAGVESGIAAARSIVEGKKYEGYLGQLKKNFMITAHMRRALNRLNNDGFDRLVSFLTTPGVRNVIYNTNIDMLKPTAALLDLTERIGSLVKGNRETENIQ